MFGEFYFLGSIGGRATGQFSQISLAVGSEVKGSLKRCVEVYG